MRRLAWGTKYLLFLDISFVDNVHRIVSDMADEQPYEK